MVDPNVCQGRERVNERVFGENWFAPQLGEDRLGPASGEKITVLVGVAPAFATDIEIEPLAGLLDGTDRAGKLTTEQLVALIRSGAAAADDETADDSLGDIAAVERAPIEVAAQVQGIRRGHLTLLSGRG